MIRIGLISYAHNDPLFYFFEERRFQNIRVIRGSPRENIRLLLGGDVDIAQISLARLSQDRDISIVRASAVHSVGPSLSAFVASRSEKVLDPKSPVMISSETETSVRMLRWVLSRRGMGNPFRVGGSGRAEDLLSDSTFALLIGDEALRAKDDGVNVVLDLGQEWFRITGRPAVFAVSAVKRQSGGEQIRGIIEGAEMIREAVRYGINNLEKVAALSSRERGIDMGTLKRYFSTLRLEYTARVEDAIGYEMREIMQGSSRPEFLDEKLSEVR